MEPGATPQQTQGRQSCSLQAALTLAVVATLLGAAAARLLGGWGGGPAELLQLR